MESTRNLRLIILALLALLGFSLFYNPFGIDENTVNENAICDDYSRESISTLKTSLISDLVERYRKNQLTYINQHMPESDSDSHSIWFDLDTIKKFIYHIEKNVQINRVSNGAKLGLRIYYGAYPEASEFTSPGYEDIAYLATDPQTMKYGLKHTLIFIPTIYNESLVDNVDFNPLDSNTYNGYISMEKSDKIKDDPNAIAPYEESGYKPMALTPSQSVMARNHGHLYPPDSMTGLGF